MRRPGPLGDVGVGAEDGVVDADGHDGQPLERHVHLAVDVGARVRRHREHRGQPARHAHLHAQEPEPAPRGEALPGALGVVERDRAVDGDRVVEGLEQRPARRVQPEDPRAQALVVVDDVEVARVAPRATVRIRREYASGSPNPRERIIVANSIDVGERRELARAPGSGRGRGRGTGRGPRTGVKPTPSSSSGHGGPGEDLDAVAERDELAGQVAGVDALAAAARVAPVDEEGDPPPARRRAAAARTRVGQTDRRASGPTTPARRRRDWRG